MPIHRRLFIAAGLVCLIANLAGASTTPAKATPIRRLHALTGTAPAPLGTDFGDPSAPDFSDPQFVRVYTTGGEVLTWTQSGDQTAKARFFAGAAPAHQTLHIYHHDGTPFNFSEGEDIWDPTIETSVTDRAVKILYAGAMTPPDDRPYARWPDDNWSRRTYAFEWLNGRWVMRDKPLFGDLPAEPTWVGHNYGHQFIEVNGVRYVFYERVSEERADLPWRTELFARRMIGDFAVDPHEIAVLKLGPRPWPVTAREAGGFLVEGARPFYAHGKFLISFSAGDYTSDHYGIHLLWSTRIEGPYRPYLNADRKNLRDFGAGIEQTLALTWGAGRAVFFREGGQWWTLFHGIKATPGEARKDGQRNLYLAPVRIQNRGVGAPKLEILREEP